MSRLSSAILSSILAAVLLSGCQGGTPGAGPSETSPTTASPTSSVSSPAASATQSALAVYKPADASGKAQNVPVPVMPELARENSKAGLEAFIGYWYATETGDLGPWGRGTDVTTLSGAAYKKAVEVNYAEGRWVVGGRITTPVIEVLWRDQADPQAAKVQVLQEQIQYFDADGNSGQQPTPEYNTAEAVMASYRNGGWQVIDNGLIVG
ncbi:UNVERIFIED_ORG: hypothetical protein J3D58_002557 [Paenarthrobacter nicotinovorans]